jgi:hypothetical protein
MPNPRKPQELDEGGSMSWRLTNAQQASGSANETHDEGQEIREIHKERMTRMNRRLPIAIASLLVVAAVATAASLSSASSAANSAEGLQLDGAWMVTVTRVNPPPGVAPTFKSLLSYARGGVMIETSNTGTTRRGAALGQWERIGNDLFATSMWLFRFDPATGASLGTQEIDRTMRLSADGESFTAVALIHIFDADGNQVGDVLHATEVGTRLAINRNPDQP